MNLLVTNNPMVLTRVGDKLKTEYVDAGLIDVLIRVRDLVHEGHSLLTHPLSGSVKPNDTIYKSVLVSGARAGTDEQSVRIIGECVLAAQKFTPREVSESSLRDLQAVEFALIREAIGL